MPKSGTCPRCGNAVRHDNTDWVCTACSRRWPIPAGLLPKLQPTAPAQLSVNRCRICAMPAPAGQNVCQDPECQQYVAGACRNCGAAIVTQSKTGQRLAFCCQLCKVEGHSAQRSTLRHSALAANVRHRARCGNVIPPPPQGNPGRPRKYCTNSCYQAARTKRAGINRDQTSSVTSQ